MEKAHREGSTVVSAVVCIACTYLALLLGEEAHDFGCVDVLEIRSFDPSWTGRGKLVR